MACDMEAGWFKFIVVKSRLAIALGALNFFASFKSET